MSIGDSDYENSDVLWTAVSLTHVEYPKGDKLGYVLAWFSLIPIFMCVSFVTLILFRRDLHTMAYFAGLVINEAVNWTLKHFIKELRPLRKREIVFTEYGMPSSHAQFMSFFTVYLVLFLYLRLHHQSKFMDNIWKHIVLLVSLSVLACVAYSRIYLMYHSVLQVCYGLLAGTILAGAWFFIVHHVFSPVFPVITSWTISQYLMIRDSTLIPNVFWFEYCAQRNEVRNRLRKLAVAKKKK